MENRNRAISFLLLLSTLLSLSHPLAAALEPSKNNITAVFAFGDSTLDAGNNNGLLTLVRADHAPYGRDFPGQVPTGRFTNGKLITDFLVSSLGLNDALPAYANLNLSVAELATGVSFASGGSGLDDLTATTVGVITVGQQVANFASYIEKLQAAVGNDEASRIIRDAMFVIGAGSNDMMMNYYILPLRKITYTVPRYQSFLVSHLEDLVLVYIPLSSNDGTNRIKFICQCIFYNIPCIMRINRGVLEVNLHWIDDRNLKFSTIYIALLTDIKKLVTMHSILSMIK